MVSNLSPGDGLRDSTEEAMELFCASYMRVPIVFDMWFHRGHAPRLLHLQNANQRYEHISAQLGHCITERDGTANADNYPEVLLTWRVFCWVVQGWVVGFSVQVANEFVMHALFWIRFVSVESSGVVIDVGRNLFRMTGRPGFDDWVRAMSVS